MKTNELWLLSYFRAPKIGMVSLDMIKGLTIIGIAILVIGIVVFATGTYVYSVQSSNVQQCQSITGELG
ncbi:MAG: hypothetical protein ACRD8Z_13215 [Nitrososphaeraceae archaeon]